MDVLKTVIHDNAANRKEHELEFFESAANLSRLKTSALADKRTRRVDNFHKKSYAFARVFSAGQSAESR